MRQTGRAAHLPTSERLHSDAWQHQRRLEDRQMRVEAAARRRANPELTASAKSVPHNRGDVTDRLYEHAILAKEDALERENVERSSPRGATFHPEISPWSEALARRRRDRWRLRDCEQSARGGGRVEETLLAEGVMYARRRQERRDRQETLQKVLRQSVRPNRHSERLLREVERRGTSNGAPSEVGQGGGKQWTVATESDGDGVQERASFRPTLEALDKSKELLESR